MDVRSLSALNEAQTRRLHALYQNEWWTRGRTLDDVREMLRHSDYVFGLEEVATGELVAFARVLTDRVYKAFVFDVIVAPEARDRGLGRVVMDEILRHPDLARVRHVELYCLPELVPFYARWGFTSETGGVVLVRKVTGTT